MELQILDAAGKRFFRDILDGGHLIPLCSCKFFICVELLFFFPYFSAEFYHVVEGIMIVYDIASAESFGDIHLWMRGLEKFTFLQKIIVGNKGDLGSARVCFSNLLFFFFPQRRQQPN